jgi:hypothetical protein
MDPHAVLLEPLQGNPDIRLANMLQVLVSTRGWNRLKDLRAEYHLHSEHSQHVLSKVATRVVTARQSLVPVHVPAPVPVPRVSLPWGSSLGSSKKIYVQPARILVSLNGTEHRVLVYVDNCLLITCKANKSALLSLKSQLASIFDIHDMGDAKFFLGMEIVRNRERRTLVLSQQRFIYDLLNKCNMTETEGKSV